MDQFLDSLINYDKENIHENCQKAIKEYLNDPEFDADFIKGKSLAAGGLCSWVINIVKFYNVYCDVEPKRIALQKANEELKAAQDKLAVIKAKIAVSFLFCDCCCRTTRAWLYQWDNTRLGPVPLYRNIAQWPS